ncbi:ArpA protein [Pseudomonas sp. zjy_15]|uniref:HalD/BesD family halogenase n=1 Tax=Pseudomonas TaxID=286 RepID=UPI00159E5B04|nr:ArpA protein [Pseudomonas putida]NVN63945.1 ArpA protein [Pseudomonas putida]NVN68867.1 ArpA protein [Pseudomonas putida]
MPGRSVVEQNTAHGKNILESDPFEGRDFFWEQHRFARDGYLKINHLIDSEVRDRISEDVKYLLVNFAKRRDFLIESTGNTPRYLSNVPQEIIEAHGRYISLAYKSRYLMSLISHIVKEDIIPTPWKWDNFIINSQHKSGDTHGWHWGDYPYTIIWVVEAPELEAGGLLECVPHTNWDKRNPRVENLLVENKIDSYFHLTGDVYLLKADTTLHRVKPLTRDVTRTILNTTWERARDKDRQVEHETFVFRD